MNQKPVRVVNQQKVTVEKRLIVRVSKSENACLVKSCDTDTAM